MNELALFSGSGGGILGGKLLGWRTVCAVEIDKYCRRVLMQRQDDGIIEPFPIWDDVTTFDGLPWRGIVDVVSGGFPCQDISVAGKGAGLDGSRSGLWVEMARIIREISPRFALVENSPMLTLRGLGRVLGDLAEMGYDARWGVLGANHAGAPHKRERIWILAYSTGDRRESRRSEPKGFEGEIRPVWSGSSLPDADGDKERTGRRERRKEDVAKESRGERIERINWWTTEPDLGRVAHGVADRVDRLQAIGNGQVPAVVRLAWETLMQL